VLARQAAAAVGTGTCWERVDREKLLLRCRLLGCARRFGTHGGRRGAGHIVAAARLQLVLFQTPQTVFHSVTALHFYTRASHKTKPTRETILA